MPFRPKVEEEIRLHDRLYRFTEHPSAKGMPYGQTGRRATVFQLQDAQGGKHALKVFTLAFRNPQTETQAQRIAQFKSIRGLQACERIVLSQQSHPEIIQQYPDLKYAVVMPWVQGMNWQEAILTRRALTPDASHRIAGNVIRLLSTLEKQGIAHCDLSGPNLLLQVNGHDGPAPASLIDLEDMYAAGLEVPSKKPAGSAGYAHRQAQHGLWSPEADRFAGGILIAEVLAWCDERIRRIACSEQYFDPSEMQTASERYLVMVQVLRERWGEPLANAFIQTWFAESLKDCPSFAEWERCYNPPPDPDEMFSQLLRAERMGRWNEVLPLSDEVLHLDPKRTAVWPIRARAQKLLQMEPKIESARQQASQTGTTVDWESYLQQVNLAYLTAPQVVLYQSQRAHGEIELETALKLDEIEMMIKAGQWKEARQKLNQISPIQPRYIPVKLEVDRLEELYANVENLRKKAQFAVEANNWQEAIDLFHLIQQLQPLDTESSLLLKKAIDEKEDALKQQNALHLLQSQMRSGNYQEALRQAQAMLMEWPNHLAALNLKEEIELRIAKMAAAASIIEKARSLARNGRLIEANEALLTIVNNSSEAASLHQSILRRINWRNDLQRAKDEWDMRKVLVLLDQKPPEESENSVLRSTAQKVSHIEEKIEEARRNDDLSQLVVLISQLPENHPERNTRLESLQQELMIRDRLKKGFLQFDVSLVESAYAMLPEQDRRRESIGKWIKDETNYRASAEAACQAGNIVGIRELIKSLPSNHPVSQQLSQWLQAEETLRNQYADAVDSGNLMEMEQLLNTMTPDHILHPKLVEHIRIETARSEKIALAQSLFDVQSILDELLFLNKSHFAYEEVSTWVQDELKRQNDIREAMKRKDRERVKLLYADLPINHPFQVEVAEWLGKQQDHLK